MILALGGPGHSSSPVSQDAAWQAVAELRQNLLSESPDPELKSLSRETDPELFLESLLALVGRWERQERRPDAQSLYALIAELPLQGNLASIAVRAREGLNSSPSALQQTANFAKSLFEQATDPTAILGFGAASAAFKFTRIGLLAWAALNPTVSPIRASLARGLVNLAALGAESLAMTATNRGVHRFLGLGESKSFRGELFSNSIFMGALHLSGATVRPLLQRFDAVPVLGAASRRILPQLATLAGIMAGHRAEAWAGLRPMHEGAQAWIDGLATFAHIHVGGHVANRLLGSAFVRMEEGERIRVNGIERGISQRLRDFSRGFSEGIRNAHWNLFWGMMGAGGLGGGVRMPERRSEPKNETERVSRFLRPYRPRLEEARAAMEGVSSPQEAWEALQNVGLIPESWLDPMRCGFCFRKEGKGNGNIENLPTSVEMAVTVAADALSIQRSFELIREIRSRMSYLYRPAPALVVLNPTKSSLDYLVFKSPYSAMPKRGKLSERFFSQIDEHSEEVQGEIARRLGSISLNFKKPELRFIYQSYLMAQVDRQEASTLEYGLNRGLSSVTRQERSVYNPSLMTVPETRKQLEELATALKVLPSKLRWDMLPDVWEPYLGIMDQGYLFTHSLTVVKSGQKIMGNFLYVPPLER